MAEKSTTLIIEVLDCPRCYKKISKVLCKLQATADQGGIRTVSYDGKKQTISISGPFDPILLGCKLRSMAGKVIRDIQIKPKPSPPPSPSPDIKHLELKVADLQRKQQICVYKNWDIDQMKPRVADLERQQRICVDRNRVVEQLKWDMAKLKEREQICARQTGHDGRSCHCQPTVHIPPCYSGRYDGCSCDKVHGGTVQPMLVACHGGAPYCGCYRGCQFVSEEDSSTGCRVK